MVIEVNKDIDRYQESVAMGLTARQLIFSIASVVVGGGINLLSSFSSLLQTPPASLQPNQLLQSPVQPFCLSSLPVHSVLTDLSY